jgi:hypothetical protein
MEDDIKLSQSENLLNGRIIGGGLLGATGIAHAMRQAGPGGMARMFADNASNYLEGFYDAGVGQFKKLSLYGQEAFKTSGRLINQSINPLNNYVYQRTGVSDFLEKNIDDIGKEVLDIKNRYIGGEFKNTDSAQKAIKHIINKRHHKVTSDFSNSFMLGGKRSGAIGKYAKNFVNLSDVNSFVSDVGGNRKIADYIMGQQPGMHLNKKGLTLMKYKNVPFADVLRGAQFDAKGYKAMLLLRDSPLSLHGTHSQLKKLIPNTHVINKKIVFSISPQWKSNYDWGGYNAVGIWDPKNKANIKFAATDSRDVAAGLRGGGKPTVNYVSSKEVAIKDATKIMKETIDPDKVPTSKTRNRKRLLTRAEKVKNGVLDVENFSPQYNKRLQGLNEISTINKKYRTGISKHLTRGGAKGYTKFLRRWGGRRGAILAGGLLAGSAILEKVLDS